MYQLRERESSILLQQTHFQVGTARICQGKDRLDNYYVYRKHKTFLIFYKK